MGLTIAPGLPPLLFSLSLPATMTTGQFGSLFHTVFFFFSLSFSATFFMDVNGVFINLLLNHGVRGLQGIYFFASAQVANAGCMCSMIVYFLHCICVCNCDGRHESLIMLSHSVMVRSSHLLARCVCARQLSGVAP
jgi:hypothetical protein